MGTGPTFSEGSAADQQECDRKDLIQTSIQIRSEPHGASAVTDQNAVSDKAVTYDTTWLDPARALDREHAERHRRTGQPEPPRSRLDADLERHLTERQHLPNGLAVPPAPEHEHQAPEPEHQAPEPERPKSRMDELVAGMMGAAS